MRQALWTLVIVVALAVPATYYWALVQQNRQPSGGRVAVALLALVAVSALMLGFAALGHPEVAGR